ncbi:MAG TPA: hypothetical protein VH723_02685 [Candidatus Limnocylindrales bacterium]|jgi:hypothetical protein
MNTTPQEIIVTARIAALRAEAAANRAAKARAPGGHRTPFRTVLGHRLIVLGAAVASVRVVDDPCGDTVAAQRA